jgi:small subunit ribosomal protein S2
MSQAVQFTMRDLLDAGVHFGHKKNYWNPKMAQYVYGTRNGIHIIDLQQTYPMLHNAMNFLKDVAAKGGKILFVATKRQATELLADYAQRCGQYYVNHRWLGGMLTNWSTISASIRTLQDYEETIGSENNSFTKKEKLDLDRKRIKLDKVLGGIRTMGGKPDAIFIIDTNRESLAISEAKRLGIPVIAIIDTNCNPDPVDLAIPGNDDASKAIELYLRLASEAILAGIQEGLANAGVDVGSVEFSADEMLGSIPHDVAEEKGDKAPRKKGATVVTKKKATAKKPAENAAAKAE